MWRRGARRIRRARLASLRLALVASALFATPGRAQTPPPQKPELLPPVSAEVVRVDVVVTDKSGKARPGLTRDDFEVLEDGQPQAITQFEAFAAPSASPTSAGVQAPQAATLAPKGLTHHRFAPLSPGCYRVSLAVREDGAGKAGSATQWVEIPDLAEGKPTLSSLFLMRDDGAALLPVQAHRVYGRDESLHLEFFAYNLGRHPQASPVTRTEIWRNGRLLAASRKEPIEPPRSGGTRVAHTRKIKLRPFDPGEYEVRIVLTDEQADTSTSQRAGFRID